MIVLLELEQGLWICNEFDPPFTTHEDEATEFESYDDAMMAIKDIQDYGNFPNAMIVDEL